MLLCGVFQLQVKEGTKTHEQILTDFMAQWESSHTTDGKVTFEEFASYYDDLSGMIDSDDYFCFMVARAWGLGDEKK